MLIEEYLVNIEKIINLCPFVYTYQIVKDKRSLYVAFIEGKITFIDNSFLHFMEFIDCSGTIKKYKYSYHYQGEDKKLIFRYDNAPHFREISTFPHHKHQGKHETIASKEPSLENILFEIEKMILNT